MPAAALPASLPAMSRARRLLELMQILRRHRQPVRGAALAAELGVSLRTLYRDIVTLQAQGASIEGEAGMGYVLRPGYLLPPLMFSREEIEALVLGSRWVADRGDATLSLAARDVLAKVGAILPEELRRELDTSGLLVAPRPKGAAPGPDLAVVRAAIRAEVKVAIDYRDQSGAATHRIVWPFALGYFEDIRLIIAWCELRSGFRHFRADRILRLEVTRERYPRRRPALLGEWQERELGAARDGRPARC